MGKCRLLAVGQHLPLEFFVTLRVETIIDHDKLDPTH